MGKDWDGKPPSVMGAREQVAWSLTLDILKANANAAHG
jgi:hypothetical protein